MRLEHITRRVLGAVRPVDVNSGLRLTGSFTVEAEGVRFVRNRRGEYVIFNGPGFDHYVRAFEEVPDTPAVGSVGIDILLTDPTGRYLPRRHSLLLPRDPNPDNAGQPASLFRPAPVALFPSPTAPIMPGWAVLRATVTDDPPGDARPTPLPGALILITRVSDAQLVARGISSWLGRTRGEAMVVVPGIPITTWGDGNGNGDGPGRGRGRGRDGGDDDGEDTPVLVNEIQLNAEVIYDSDFNPAEGDIPDPDDLEARRDELPRAQFEFPLASGQVLAMTFRVPLEV
jgi:hypothetical protein